jgi:hypothetical protein
VFPGYRLPQSGVIVTLLSTTFLRACVSAKFVRRLRKESST